MIAFPELALWMRNQAIARGARRAHEELSKRPEFVAYTSPRDVVTAESIFPGSKLVSHPFVRAGEIWGLVPDEPETFQ